MAQEDKSNMLILTIVVAVAVIGLIVVLMGQKSNTVVGKGMNRKLRDNKTGMYIIT